MLVEIKPNFGAEKYLKLDLDRYDKSLLSQFRYRILPLELETGRYKGIDRENRLCTLCNTGEIEDQIHFSFTCPVYDHFRTEFTNTCKDRILRWDNMCEVYKISSLFESQP